MLSALRNVRVLPPPQQWVQGMTCACSTSQRADYHNTFLLLSTNTSVADNSAKINAATKTHDAANSSEKLNTCTRNANIFGTRGDFSGIPFHSSIVPERIEHVAFTINNDTNTNTNTNTNLNQKNITADSDSKVNASSLSSSSSFTTTTTSPSSESSTSSSTLPPTCAAEPTASTSNSNTSIILDDNELIDELRRVVNRPLLIGDLFRSLSPAAKKTFAKKKMTLEEFLLHHGTYFSVYRTGRLSMQFKRIRVMLMVAPPFLVPSNAEVVPPIADDKSEAEQTMTSGHSSMTDTSRVETSSSTDEKVHVDTLSHGNSNAEMQTSTLENPTTSSLDSKALERRMNTKQELTLKERMETVLQYIPNELESFSNLNIPRAVKVKCMNYPIKSPLSFFKKYPQYFEVTEIDLSIGSFKVRRSLTLQRRIEAYVKKKQ